MSNEQIQHPKPFTQLEWQLINFAAGGETIVSASHDIVAARSLEARGYLTLVSRPTGSYTAYATKMLYALHDLGLVNRGERDDIDARVKEHGAKMPDRKPKSVVDDEE
jgi:hypothetical protein